MVLDALGGELLGLQHVQGVLVEDLRQADNLLLGLRHFGLPLAPGEKAEQQERNDQRSDGQDAKRLQASRGLASSVERNGCHVFPSNVPRAPEPTS